MAGIYVHIPFCRQACHYCDFHFSTNLKLKNELLNCIVKEIILQKDYLNGEQVETIYLGGGTPSLLSGEQLHQLINDIKDTYEVTASAEISIECNPDDIDSETLQGYHEVGINRLSLGVQSFNEEALKFLNRVHHTDDALQAIATIKKSKISNYSIDLIYAIPSGNHSNWHQDLQTAIGLNPPHISSYCLTIEEKTVFGNWLKNKKLEPIDDDFAAEQFEHLMHELKKSGYDQYEISNFGLPGFHSKHNINYWQHGKFLGLGPGAHSFDGINRQFNVLNNPNYIRSIDENKVPYELIKMSKTDRLNEYILTSLRTQWGIDLQYLKTQFNLDLTLEKKREMELAIEYKNLEIIEHYVRLTDRGKLLADQIAANLFI